MHTHKFYSIGSKSYSSFMQIFYIRDVMVINGSEVVFAANYKVTTNKRNK